MPLNSPILTGDVSGGVHSTSVDKLKGQPVATTAPTSGQVLTWDGTQWAPANSTGGGGGGANGLTYYMNSGVNADAPVTGIPGTPKQLGRSAQASQIPVTTSSLTPDTWTLVAGFVTESTPQDPYITRIPAGLWDFNVWAFGVADQNHSNSIRFKAYLYRDSTLTLIGTSAEEEISNVSSQYSLSMLVEQRNILATDRIYVAIEALATGNGHTVTAQFGLNTPSHVHTSLPLVGGTGLWKSVSGTLQSPATLLVDADVDAAAAIAQSKIANLTTDLGNKAGTAQVDVYATAGTFTWTKPAGAKTVTAYVIAGGGGGGSGRASASGTAAGGGGGGGGSARTFVTIDAAFLGATETVTVGAGGLGAIARAVGQDGLAGGNGSPSSFGLWASASQGGGGGAGTSTAGGTAGAQGSRGLFSGAAGGLASATFGVGGNGNASSSCPSGGAGGGVTSAGAASTGGTGGFQFLYNGSAQSATPANTAGGSVPANLPYGGAGGGGGNASVSAAANAGGNGGNYGAGGGGGGGSQGFNSGAGGNGGQGIVVVITHF